MKHPQTHASVQANHVTKCSLLAAGHAALLGLQS